jgi:hypothetical protein
MDGLIQKLGPEWTFRIIGLTTLATSLPAAWLIKERIPITTNSFIEWYSIPSSLNNYGCQLTSITQETLQKPPIHHALPRRRNRDLSPFRSPLLPSPLLHLARSFALHWRRSCSRIQLLLRSWPSCMRVPIRFHRTCQHPFHSIAHERHEYASHLACVEYIGSADCVCRYKRDGEWRVLQHDAYGCGERVWESSGGCCNGDDCYRLGWWISIGKRPCFTMG